MPRLTRCNGRSTNYARTRWRITIWPATAPLQQREQEALTLLKSALHLDPKLKVLAKAEPDFVDLRKTPGFQALLTSR